MSVYDSFKKAQAAKQSINSAEKEVLAKIRAGKPQSVEAGFRERITDIINTKAKFSSIEEKIKDMQERAGINKLASVQNARNLKIAYLAAFEPKDIKLFQMFPAFEKQIKEFIEAEPFTDQLALTNKISNATTQLLQANKNKDVKANELVDDPALKKFISDLIDIERKGYSYSTQIPTLKTNKDITEDDLSKNNDILSALQPATR